MRMRKMVFIVMTVGFPSINAKSDSVSSSRQPLTSFSPCWKCWTLIKCTAVFFFWQKHAVQFSRWCAAWHVSARNAGRVSIYCGAAKYIVFCAVLQGFFLAQCSSSLYYRIPFLHFRLYRKQQSWYSALLQIECAEFQIQLNCCTAVRFDIHFVHWVGVVL